MSDSNSTNDYSKTSDGVARATVSPWIRCLMQVLWPAFVGAGVTVGLLFSLIDPTQIEWVNVHLDDSREASYTLGFLLLWVLYTLACSLTWYLATTETPQGRIDARKSS